MLVGVLVGEVELEDGLELEVGLEPDPDPLAGGVSPGSTLGLHVAEPEGVADPVDAPLEPIGLADFD